MMSWLSKTGGSRSGLSEGFSGFSCRRAGLLECTPGGLGGFLSQLQPSLPSMGFCSYFFFLSRKENGAFRQEGGRGLAICTWRQPATSPHPRSREKNWGNGRVTFIRSEVSPPTMPSPNTQRGCHQGEGSWCRGEQGKGESSLHQAPPPPLSRTTSMGNPRQR